MDALLRILFLICVGFHAVGAYWDTQICSPVNSSNHPRPKLPPMFEVHVECNIVNKNFTTEVHEYFSATDNKGAIHQLYNNVEFYGLFDFPNNQYIQVVPNAQQCTVMDLGHSDNRYLFGYNVSSHRVFSASGALNFASYTPEEYKNSDIIRGIKVETWHSCQNWPGVNATMNVWWYFSSPTEWNMALNMHSTPIRVYVKGTSMDENSPLHNFEHYYDFMHFKPYIDTAGVFETPALTTCPGRKQIKTFPYLPRAFTFTMEIVQPSFENVRFMKESYDKAMNVVKFEYIPTSDSNRAMYGTNPLTEIHDFNSGMAYVIDNIMGNCSWGTIEPNLFDVKLLNDSYDVRIRTAKEFFYMDTDLSITYEGTKMTRNINTDTFAAKKLNFDSQSASATLEWHFLASDYAAVQQYERMQAGAQPVQLRIVIPQYFTQYDYNIYNFVAAQPHLLTWDISACFYNLNRRKFDFTVPGSYRSVIIKNQEMFRYGVLMELQYRMKVSAIRITQIKLVFLQDVHVRFELLDIAPMQGNVKVSATQTPLDTAANAFLTAINSGQLSFIVNMPPPVNGIFITANPNSVQEYVYETELAQNKSGYSGGAMGGLAVAMIIVGGLVGALLAFFFFK